MIPRGITVAITLGILGIQCALAQTTWTAVSGVAHDTNWSTAGNWSAGTVPGPSTNVVFEGTTAVNSSPFAAPGNGGVGVNDSRFNSFMDGGFAGTIASLTYTNVGNTWQNTLLNSSDMLLITGPGGLVVGNGMSGVDYGSPENVTIAGTTSTLDVNSSSASVWVTMGGASAETATLDLSGLGTFTATISRFLVGVPGNNRPSATVYLAHNNTITAEFQTGTSESNGGNGNGAFVVGDSAVNPGGNDYLYLGYQNSISASTILTGRQKVPSAVMQFNPIYFFNGSGPSATFTGYPSGAVQIWSIGDGVVNGGTANCTGINDFSLGEVNASVTTMYVGRAAASGAGTGTANGTLTFGFGTFTVGTLFVGYQPTTGAKNGIGTVNVTSTPYSLTGPSSGILRVNTSLNLAVTAGGTGAASTAGTLTVTNGGTALVDGITTGAGGVSTINIGSPYVSVDGPPAGGTLSITSKAGSPGAPVSALNLYEGATIHLNVDGSLSPIPTNIVANTVTANDATVIVIDSIANVPVSQVFPLIAYEGADPFGSLFLGSPPSGYSCQLIDDTQNSRIDLQVNHGTVPLSIFSQPAGQTLCAGNIATFTVGAGGTGPLTYQWQYSPDGSTWYGLTASAGVGVFSPVFSFPAQASQNGYQYRVMVSNGGTSLPSGAATLTVNTAPAITVNPSSRTVANGQMVTFTAAASGAPTPSVQWQYSQDGGMTWSPVVPAQTSVTFSFEAVPALDGDEYEAIFMNECGIATTAPATLTVPLSIIQQPASQTVCEGDAADFTVSASGPNLAYQWQVSTGNGATWSNVGADSSSLDFTPEPGDAGNQYRVIISDGGDMVTSGVATLGIDTGEPVISLSPASQTITGGQQVTFNSSATGPSDTSVQWVVLTDNGMTRTAIPGATSPTLTFTVDQSENGNQYLAAYSDACGTLGTTPARLTVQQPTLTITANNASTTYGGGGPALSVDYSGFVNGDTPASLTTPPIVSTTGTSSSPAGSYPITATGAVDPNYNIIYVPGTLTINPAPLTITANNATKAYGAAVPALSVGYSGFVNGDTSASLTATPTVSTTGTSSSPAGNYPITATGAVDPNYTIAYVQGTLTITYLPLVITWADPADLQVGTPLSATQLDATANVAGTFIYDPPAGTVLPLGQAQTLSVTFTPADTTDYPNPVTQTAAINIGLISGLSSVCVNSAGNTASGPAGESSYSWTISGGVITSGAAAQTVTYTAGASVNVILTLMVEDASSDTASGSDTIPINMCQPAPVIAPPPGGVCANSSGNTASGGMPAGGGVYPAGYTYSWIINNGTITDGANDSMVTFTAGAAGVVTLSLTVVSPSGEPSNVGSQDVAIYPYAASPVITPPPGGVCANSSGNTVSGGMPAGGGVYPAGYTYSWIINNGTITDGANDSMVTFTAGAAGVVTLSLTVVSPSGCASSVASQDVAIYPYAASPVITPPPGGVCANSSGNTVSGGMPAGGGVYPAGYTYSWIINNGTITDGANDSMVTFTAGAAGVVTLSLTVVSPSGCASSVASQDVAIYPYAASPVITPPPGGVCANSSGNTVSGGMPAGGGVYPAGYTYSWIINNGTITDGANDSMVTFTAGAAGVVTLSLTVVSPSGCASSVASQDVAIYPYAASPVITPPPGGVCANSSGNTVSGGMPAGGGVYPAGYTYSWIINNGTITDGANDSMVTFTAGAAGVVTLSLTVVSPSGCASSVASQDVAIYPYAASPVITPPPGGVCANSSGNTVSGGMPAGGGVYPAGYTYSWIINNGTITDGANDSMVTFTAGAAGVVTLSLTVVSPSGCASSVASQDVAISSPVANADFLGTEKGAALTAPAASFLANDSGPPGLALSILGVSSPSTPGATAAFAGGIVTYTPASGFTGQDQFTYILGDGSCTATGNVTVTVTPPQTPPFNNVALRLIGTCRVFDYTGVAGQQYVVESAPSVSGPWTDISPDLTADSTGHLTYNDCNPSPPGAQYYALRRGP